MKEPYICINTHGAYLVEIPLPQDAQEATGEHSIRRTFTPSVLGGAKKALKAAKDWRDEQGRDIYGPTQFNKMLKFGRRMPKRKVRENARSGIAPGVFFEAHRGPEGAYTACWVHWDSPDKKRNKSKTFSVRKYGSDQARKLALAARKQGVAAGMAHHPGERHDRSERRGGLYRDGDGQAWVAIWKEQNQTLEKRFPDSDYPRPIDSKPASWWSYLDAISFRREKDLEIKGHSYLPVTDRKLQTFYEQKIAT